MRYLFPVRPFEFVVNLALMLRYIFLVFVLPYVCSSQSFATTLPVSADNKPNTTTFAAALSKAKPGDTIILEAGTYAGTYKAKNAGTESAPIRIIGKDSNVIFDGQTTPKKSGGQCIKIEQSKWLVFENLKMRNCWSAAIKVESSQHLTFKKLDVEGGRFAIKAESPDTQYITIEDSHWNQDPSGMLWKELSWEEAHHGKYSYFNGSILGADGIAGDVVIRRTLIENAYNGIRMEGDPKRIREINANVEIYENTFRRIRGVIAESWGRDSSGSGLLMS